MGGGGGFVAHELPIVIVEIMSDTHGMQCISHTNSSVCYRLLSKWRKYMTPVTLGTFFIECAFFVLSIIISYYHYYHYYYHYYTVCHELNFKSPRLRKINRYIDLPEI